MNKRLALCTFLMIAFSDLSQAARMYVDCDISVSGDGLSWATAKRTIIEAALSFDSEVWVKEGCYRDEIGPLAVNFYKGKIYGGFAGTETMFDERNPLLSPTIIVATDRSLNFDGLIDGCLFVNNVIPGKILIVYGQSQLCIFNNGIRFHKSTLHDDNPSADSCIFLGSAIGMYSTSSVPLTVKNSLFCGNSEYGFLADEGSDAVVDNCTFVDAGLRSEPYESVWQGVTYYTGGEVTVRNSIFYKSRPIYSAIAEDIDCEVYPINCLFWDNISDFSNWRYGRYYGADEINAGVNGARDNISGNPAFRHGAIGAWSQAPVYDPARCRTRLVNSATTFTPGRLRGEILNPDTTQKLNAYILDNGDNWIEVLGDVTTYAAQGEPYQVLNYRLPSGSAALDAGTLEGAPPTDKEEYSRPYDIMLQGREGQDTVDIGCYEAHPARRPREGDVIPTDAVYNVRWDKTYFPDSKIRIEMWREGQYLKTVRVRTDNDGVLEWRPGDEPLPAQLDNLQLRLCSRNESAIVHTSEIFSIRRETGTGKVWLEYQ